MRKILFTIFVTSVLCFFQLLHLFGDSKEVIDFEKINKAFDLIYESNDYENDGKTIKSKHSLRKAEAILKTIFKKGTIISATDNCYFIKKNCGYHSEENIEFILSCFQPEATDYGINGLKNILVFDVDKKQTKEKIVEEFENVYAFNGEIQITKDSYKFGSFPEIIEVNCKILSLTPIKTNEYDVSSNSNGFNDDNN